VPIGTIRLVPFPHPPHPRDGGIYVDGKLTNAGQPAARVALATDAKGKGAAANKDETSGKSTKEDITSKIGKLNIGDDSAASSSATAETRKVVAPLTHKEVLRSPPTSLPRYAYDRPTTFHNGEEAYVKLGRLAVREEFRRFGIASQLVRAATKWMLDNPTAFNPRPSVTSFDHLGLAAGRAVPEWRGLFCVHAQESAIGFWERQGFAIDEKMGRWFEEGIPHVGMFKRVDYDPLKYATPSIPPTAWTGLM